MKLISLLTALSTSVICSPYSEYQGTRSQKTFSCDLSKVNEIKRTEKLPINVIKRLNQIGCYEEAEAYEDDIPSNYNHNTRSDYNNYKLGLNRGNSDSFRINEPHANPSFYNLDFFHHTLSEDPSTIQLPPQCTDSSVDEQISDGVSPESLIQLMAIRGCTEQVKKLESDYSIKLSDFDENKLEKHSASYYS
ncbi:hypothetical protein CONCODRAFT_13080 [Conidiobolus coronatus NRRL 28638]|uniref:Uncharacterized protein n=1 Tax=Conidiobolus coronatus (strain ATCC 28846 / CBS 209.66 / NRRL 28638) TaxID=796925 RepID=A0A137NRJ0_CONC2|nr:hypothetical protein CONCODRAFT_13080 [Conidiobolus coronatus NRRL 28638]|eukprot:KXN65355.1 hypothetical protein CONCODRAFT_13080 [Conidiobolus coronatus NRRL 28638]